MNGGTDASRNYISYYGITLLDDIHNFFPALLYDTSRFDTIQNVLNYIQTQTREIYREVDLYSIGRQNYLESVASSALVSLASGVTTGPVRSQRRFEQEFRREAAQVYQLPSSRPSSELETNMGELVTTITYEATLDPRRMLRGFSHSNIPTTSTQSILNLLNSILHDEATDIFGVTTSNFLAPVIVRPTSQQLESATSTGILEVSAQASDPCGSSGQPPVAPFCTVCQDTMAVGDNYRTINTCSHTFHKECIDTWFMTHYICPVCRHDIREVINPMEQMD